MKKIILLLLLSVGLNAQNKFQADAAGASEFRGLINSSDAYFLSVDFSTVAEFKSGAGEYVNFYPAELKNLNTNAVTKGLKVMMKIDVPIKLPDGKTAQNFLFRSILLDASDVKAFIAFLEKNVASKVGKADKKDPKMDETTIKFKEVIFSYTSQAGRERVTMYARDYGVTGRDNGEAFIEFWTESQVDKLPVLLSVLKKII
ncbi:MAG: hypothetical protein PSX36_06095 [bacterium]|nr:hypothetical protein [bacterium]